MVSAGSRHTHTATRTWPRIVLIAALCLAGTATSALAQLGLVVSPGRLSKAHATLEGAANCQKCHTAGRKVMADQCLSCHKPVAERMQNRKGILTFDHTQDTNYKENRFLAGLTFRF